MSVIETKVIPTSPGAVSITVNNDAGGTLNWTDPVTGQAQSIPYTFANSRALALCAANGVPLVRYANYV